MPFPHPSNDAIAHSLKLIEHIKSQINQANGFLSFEQYMQAVLYTPGLGYYMSGTQKFGMGGDFITAPEISPLFGQCVAHQLAQELEQLPQRIVLEVGPGNGLLAAQVLRYFADHKLPLEAYWLLELSPDCKARQAKTIQAHIPKLFPKVRWLTDLKQIPEFSGVIFGNEIIDALPSALYQIQHQQYYERGVSFENDRFVWRTRRAEHLEDFKLPYPMTEYEENYQFEVCHQLKPWLAEMAAKLYTGSLLFIDYGDLSASLYHPARRTGTFMCHYQHHAHDDPFIYPGLQDITAHVNFEHLMEAAEQLTIETRSYQTQMQFLIGNGIEHFTDSPPTLAEQRALKRLLMPEQMGETFKVWLGRK